MSGDAGKAARVWIDGGARGNPGAAGFGVLLRRDGSSEEVCGYLGSTTNNVAEYMGLLAALVLAQRQGVERLEVFSDSQLLVRQINGQYKVKAPHLIPLFTVALKLKRAIPSVRVEHVPREQNKDADRLANRAIDQRTPTPEWLRPYLPKS